MAKLFKGATLRSIRKSVGGKTRFSLRKFASGVKNFIARFRPNAQKKADLQKAQSAAFDKRNEIEKRVELLDPQWKREVETASESEDASEIANDANDTLDAPEAAIGLSEKDDDRVETPPARRLSKVQHFDHQPSGSNQSTYSSPPPSYSSRQSSFSSDNYQPLLPNSQSRPQERRLRQPLVAPRNAPFNQPHEIREPQTTPPPPEARETAEQKTARYAHYAKAEQEIARLRDKKDKAAKELQKWENAAQKEPRPEGQEPSVNDEAASILLRKPDQIFYQFDAVENLIQEKTKKMQQSEAAKKVTLQPGKDQALYKAFENLPPIARRHFDPTVNAVLSMQKGKLILTQGKGASEFTQHIAESSEGYNAARERFDSENYKKLQQGKETLEHLQRSPAMRKILKGKWNTDIDRVSAEIEHWQNQRDPAVLEAENKRLSEEAIPKEKLSVFQNALPFPDAGKSGTALPTGRDAPKAPEKTAQDLAKTAKNAEFEIQEWTTALRRAKRASGVTIQAANERRVCEPIERYFKKQNQIGSYTAIHHNGVDEIIPNDLTGRPIRDLPTITADHPCFKFPGNIQKILTDQLNGWEAKPPSDAVYILSKTPNLSLKNMEPEKGGEQIEGTIQRNQRGSGVKELFADLDARQRASVEQKLSALANNSRLTPEQRQKEEGNLRKLLKFDSVKILKSQQGSPCQVTPMMGDQKQVGDSAYYNIPQTGGDKISMLLKEQVEKAQQAAREAGQEARKSLLESPEAIQNVLDGWEKTRASALNPERKAASPQPKSASKRKWAPTEEEPKMLWRDRNGSGRSSGTITQNRNPFIIGESYIFQAKDNPALQVAFDQNDLSNAARQGFAGDFDGRNAVVHMQNGKIKHIAPAKQAQKQAQLALRSAFDGTKQEYEAFRKHYQSAKSQDLRDYVKQLVDKDPRDITIYRRADKTGTCVSKGDMSQLQIFDDPVIPEKQAEKATADAFLARIRILSPNPKYDHDSRFLPLNLNIALDKGQKIYFNGTYRDYKDFYEQYNNPQKPEMRDAINTFLKRDPRGLILSHELSGTYNDVGIPNVHTTLSAIDDPVNHRRQATTPAINPVNSAITSPVSPFPTWAPQPQAPEGTNFGATKWQMSPADRAANAARRIRNYLPPGMQLGTDPYPIRPTQSPVSPLAEPVAKQITEQSILEALAKGTERGTLAKQVEENNPNFRHGRPPSHLQPTTPTR